MRPRTASASPCSILPFSTARAELLLDLPEPLVELALVDLAHHDVVAGLRRHLCDAVAHEATAEHSDLLDLH